ncbi:MAG: putative aminohydrolase SsnA [Chloroflexota bacterium]|nr:putative aminohydrolase SsnA [Chloroflexota bacterium]
MPIILANATLAALAPPIVKRADVLVKNGRIAVVGESLSAAGAVVVDCSGKVVMPGNVCAHTHLYSALARGMPGPSRAPRNFRDILELIWWRLDRALDEPAIRYSALVGAIDAIRCGTTSLVDHHASPNAIDGSLDIIADSLQSVGMRGLVCYEVTDRGGVERSRAGLHENARFLRENQRPLVRGMVGAHASFTLEDPTLELLASLAAETRTGVHIHVAEDLYDEQDSERRCGMRTADRLLKAGVLDQRGIAAHGVHLDQSELAALRQERTWLVHNCRSNMNNAVGRAQIEFFGDRSAFGTDGIDGDMFAESRTAFFRAREGDLAVPAALPSGMLARGGTLISEQFEDRIGVIEEGAVADLVVLDYDPPTLLDAGNLAWHWMFGMSSQQVESVMVAGEWAVQDRRLCRVDEEEVRARARVEAKRVWARMETI